jgi:hypothetical protein
MRLIVKATIAKNSDGQRPIKIGVMLPAFDGKSFTANRTIITDTSVKNMYTVHMQHLSGVNLQHMIWQSLMNK